MTVPTIASTTLRAGTIEQAHRTADALGERDDVREQPPLVRRGRRSGQRLSSLDVDVEQPHGHDDDVPIAGV